MGGSHKDEYYVIWDGADWIYVAEDREEWGVYVNIVINLRVP
jgi:hypothetical protein